MPAPLSGGCGSGGGSCANLGGSGRGLCVAKDRGRVRPCVRRASGAAGAASPLGAASSRKLPSFSFLPGFFYLKGAEVPRGLCGDRNWEFTSVSEPFLLSPLSSLLSPPPPSASALPLLGCFCSPAPPLSWAAFRVLPCLVCGHCWVEWPHRPAPVLSTALDAMPVTGLATEGGQPVESSTPPCFGVRVVRPAQEHTCGLASVSRAYISEVCRAVRFRPWSSLQHDRSQSGRLCDGSRWPCGHCGRWVFTSIVA